VSQKLLEGASNASVLRYGGLVSHLFTSYDPRMYPSAKSLGVLRLAVALLPLMFLALVAAEVALGQAGGGSSNFGGGGGGGGGGGSGGGGGGFGGGSDFGSGGDSGEAEELSGIAGLIFMVAFCVVFFGIWGAIGVAVLSERKTRDSGLVGRVAWALRDLAGRPVAAMRHKVRRKRVRQVELAATEAAEDDDYFSPQRLRTAAEDLFRDVQHAWDARDTARLATLLGADLLLEWERRLANFDAKGWHSRVEVLGDVRVDYVGLENRERDSDDRAVVLIEATLRAYVQKRDGGRIYRKGESDDTIRLCQYWTLGLREGRWILISIEERSEGEHHLAEPIIASPWSDTQGLRDEALIETATADELPAGYKPADLADLDFEGDARSEALDLSLADPRFAPDVLEAAARQVVEAWAKAVDGEDTALAELASEPALHHLLHKGDDSKETRLVVRGPRARRIAIVALDAAAEPATMTIEVELGGRRYVEDRDTAAVLSGSRDDPVTFTERWTLALDDSEAHPWRIVAVGNGTDGSVERAGSPTAAAG
jgi:predicted lipid-binding transport protein (Tim44 family)